MSKNLQKSGLGFVLLPLHEILEKTQKFSGLKMDFTVGMRKKKEILRNLGGNLSGFEDLREKE